MLDPHMVNINIKKTGFFVFSGLTTRQSVNNRRVLSRRALYWHAGEDRAPNSLLKFAYGLSDFAV